MLSDRECTRVKLVKENIPSEFRSIGILGMSSKKFKTSICMATVAGIQMYLEEEKVAGVVVRTGMGRKENLVPLHSIAIIM